VSAIDLHFLVKLRRALLFVCKFPLQPREIIHARFDIWIVGRPSVQLTIGSLLSAFIRPCFHAPFLHGYAEILNAKNYWALSAATVP